MDIKKEKKAMDIVHNTYSYYGIVIAMALYKEDNVPWNGFEKVSNVRVLSLCNNL